MSIIADTTAVATVPSFRAPFTITPEEHGLFLLFVEYRQRTACVPAGLFRDALVAAGIWDTETGLLASGILARMQASEERVALAPIEARYAQYATLFGAEDATLTTRHERKCDRCLKTTCSATT